MNASDATDAARRSLARPNANLFLRQHGCPWLLADWLEAGFLHGSLPPDRLQPFVPFPLDLHEGRAWVSLVAFRMQGLRPFLGGRLGACLFKPIAGHLFLNVRTYVQSAHLHGIYFLTELVSNLMSPWISPIAYGLPYERATTMHSEADMWKGRFRSWAQRNARGEVRELDFGLSWRPGEGWNFLELDSREGFLIERYEAFTEWHGIQRRFGIFHEPWPVVPAEFQIRRSDLLDGLGEWAHSISWHAAHFSPGVCDVWKSRPRRLRDRTRNQPNTRTAGVFEAP